MSTVLWIVLAVAVAVLFVVLAGALVTSARDRRRRRRDEAQLPSVETWTAKAAEQRRSAADLAAELTGPLDRVSLDWYLQDEKTRVTVDALLDLLGSEREDAVRVPVDERRTALPSEAAEPPPLTTTQRNLQRLREVRKQYGPLTLRDGSGPERTPER